MWYFCFVEGCCFWCVCCWIIWWMFLCVLMNFELVVGCLCVLVIVSILLGCVVVLY